MTSNTEKIYSTLTQLGYSLKDFGKEYRTKPLYRESGNPTSLAVNKDTGEWFDFSERIGGQLEYLVQLTQKLTSLEEARKLFSTDRDIEKTDDAPLIEEPKVFDKNLLIKLRKDHSYWIGRNISLETIETFEGGVAVNGKMMNRYVFPIFDLKDNLVGFDGRYLKTLWETIPKWKKLGAKSHWIYPYKWNAKYIKDEVILVESIGDMLSLWDVGIRNVLVTFGVEPSPQLISFLIKLDIKKIIIALNNDEDNNDVGNRSADKARIKICRYFDVSQVEIRLPDKKDFNEMSEQERLDWYHNTRRPVSSTLVVKIDKDEYDVYIGRDKKQPMHYGNPFDFKNGIGSVKVSNREEAIQCYEEWLRGDPKWFKVEPVRRQWILDNLTALEGRRLGCFCKPLACHGDVLVKLLKEFYVRRNQNESPLSVED